MIHIGIFRKNWKFGDVSLKTGDFEIKREDGRQPLKTGELECMLNKYFKHVYLTCGNVLVSFKVNIQWSQSRNLANIVKMPVYGVPWSLLNKVSRVSWVPECLKCHSASSTRMSWVAEDPNACRVFTKLLQSVQMRKIFGSLFVRMNKFVRNAALTGWFSYRNC